MAVDAEDDPAGAIRRNLRRLLERDWLSQREAAELIGVPYKWLRRLAHQGLERLDCRTREDVEKVASFFSLDVSDLWRTDLNRRLSLRRAKPLVKWSKCGRRESVEIVQRFPRKVGTYWEPFFGDGTVLYELLRSRVQVEQIKCCSACRPLIALWRLLKHDPRHLVAEYELAWQRLQRGGSRTFRQIRDEFNESADPARFLLLTKTCRNGIVRFDERGRFTAAHHHGRVGMLPERIKGQIEAWATQLRIHDVRFYVRDHRRIISSRGDLLLIAPNSHGDEHLGRYAEGAGDLAHWLRRQRGDFVVMAEQGKVTQCRSSEIRDDTVVDDSGGGFRLRSSTKRGTRKPAWEQVLDDLAGRLNHRSIEIADHDWKVLASAARKTDGTLQLIAERLAEIWKPHGSPLPLVTAKQRKSDFERFIASPDLRLVVDSELELLNLPVSTQASKWSRLGCRFLNSWFLESRISGSHRASPSLVEAWICPKRRASIMRAALSLKKRLNETTLYEAAALKLHIPANFRPTAARSICNDFGAGGTVLDFSAGYGGRFLGFLGSTSRHYVGIDPNSVLQRPFEKMFEWIGENYTHSRTWEVLWRPAEEVDYSPWHGEVDLVFTSPPYFDLERYSAESTQSSVRYSTMEEWLEGFLFTTLEKILPCLKREAHLVLNVADNEHQKVMFSERVVDFMTRRLRLKAIGVVPYLLAAKPGAPDPRTRVGWGRKVEPMLVFQRR